MIQCSMMPINDKILVIVGWSKNPDGIGYESEWRNALQIIGVASICRQEYRSDDLPGLGYILAHPDDDTPYFLHAFLNFYDENTEIDCRIVQGNWPPSDFILDRMNRTADQCRKEIIRAQTEFGTDPATFPEPSERLKHEDIR